MRSGGKAARSAAAVGEGRKVEGRKAECGKQQQLRIEVREHTLARVGAVSDDELYHEIAGRHQQRDRRERAAAPLRDERIEHCCTGAGEKHRQY